MLNHKKENYYKMGNCIAETEDIGMQKRASDMQAVSADVDILDDSMLEAIGQQNAALKQRLILTVSCENLPKMDKGSQTDAFCILWAMKGRNKM